MRFLFLATGASLGSAAATSHYLPRVHTSSGIVVGHQSTNRSRVTEFLGIRYAEAPVGELRFAAPKKYVAPYGTVFEAADWVGTDSGTAQAEIDLL
jgi:hypothetical protein